ncbi:MAG: methyltransferase domain-containing protein [Gemmatimonadales bacterium]
MPEAEGSDIPGLGLLCDAVPAYADRDDIQLYVKQAQASSDHVLELGCGTGRVLLPTARAGISITGIERSDEMLDQCQRTLSREPADVPNLVALYKADVRQFAIEGRFNLVTAPFRVMQLLETVEDQLACLDSVRRHLHSGGRFVFDVFNPNFHLMAHDRTAEREDTAPVRMSDGRVMRRTFRVCKIHWIDQISDVELIYYTGESADSLSERHVQSLRMRWYGRDELIHLLGRAGFGVERIDGDFSSGTLEDESPEIVVTAVRT